MQLELGVLTVIAGVAVRRSRHPHTLNPQALTVISRTAKPGCGKAAASSAAENHAGRGWPAAAEAERERIDREVTFVPGRWPGLGATASSSARDRHLLQSKKTWNGQMESRSRFMGCRQARASLRSRL
jgi:hypothetical protein